MTDRQYSEHPERIGRYPVVRMLGRGGMGVVYLAIDLMLDRHVAIKVLPTRGTDSSAAQRLIAEARAASSLDSAHIATVHEVDWTDDGRLYVVMAFCEGETLDRIIERGPLAPTLALSLARQTADGLAAAHRAHIVHRDIKPANLMVSRDGRVRILDFGIAKAAGQELTRDGGTVGTISYMSPEQTLGSNVDARSDVWSFGVVVYELLSGRRPFGAQYEAAMLQQIRHDDPLPLDPRGDPVAAGLAEIVQRCLSKVPQDRYADGGELVEALRALQASVPVTATASGAFSRRGRTSRSPAFRWTALALVLGAVWAGSELFARWAAKAAPVVPAADVVAVAPLAAPGGDPELARLGRDLVITLSRNLDGIPGMRAADPLTLLAQAGPDRPPLTLKDAVELGQGVGATGVVQGTVLPDGEGVLVEAGLYDVVTLDPVAQVSARGSSDDLAGLTDSLTLALLGRVWRARDPPTPSLAAVTTRSVEALRAYLEGEQHIARGRFWEAPDAFRRAIDADSTFAVAYWRLVYTSRWHGQPVDPRYWEGLEKRLPDLPPRDRLLAEAYLLPDSRSQRIQAFRQAAERYPDYWPAWLPFMDALIHSGPYLGTSYAEARSAAEHLVALSPDLLPGWEHLAWIALHQLDAEGAARAVGEMERLSADETMMRESGVGLMEYYRQLVALLRSGGEPDRSLTDSFAEFFSSWGAQARPHSFAVGLTAYGFDRAQIAAADSALARKLPPFVHGALLYGQSIAWAGRGAWDSALVAAGRRAELEGTTDADLHAARIAAVAAWLGTVSPDEARPWVERAARDGSPERPEVVTEVAWLQGLLSFAQGDGDGLARARARLETVDDPAAPWLLRSLVGLELAADERWEEAGDMLQSLERELADRGPLRTVGQDHPFLNAADRIAAAEWLRGAGRAEDAASLLRFQEQIFPSDVYRLQHANQAMAPLAYLQLGRAAEQLGLVPEARDAYARVLRRMDAPDPALEPLRQEAEEALGRLLER